MRLRRNSQAIPWQWTHTNTTAVDGAQRKHGVWWDLAFAKWTTPLTWMAISHLSGTSSADVPHLTLQCVLELMPVFGLLKFNFRQNVRVLGVNNLWCLRNYQAKFKCYRRTILEVRRFSWHTYIICVWGHQKCHLYKTLLLCSFWESDNFNRITR